MGIFTLHHENMKLPEHPRILLIAVPGLGDALLATPLAHSLKQAYPDSTITMMVREGRDAVLEGNNDIADVISLPRRPSILDEVRTLLRLFRKFDLVVSTSSSDRSFGNCIMASSRRAAVVPKLRLKDWWKHLGIQHRVINDDTIHVLQRNLLLCDALGIESKRAIIPPRCATSDEAFDEILGFDRKSSSYLVVHMLPEAVYKKWPESFWARLLELLAPLATRIVLTSGPLPDDIEMTRRIQARAPSNVVEIAGRLKFAQLSAILEHSIGFIGPDTSVTHLASALGIPTVALFGPSLPVKWGPWPKNFEENASPFKEIGDLQAVSNVRLLKANCHCVPHKNTCTASSPYPSACLASISPEQVVMALQDVSPSLLSSADSASNASS